MITYDAYDLNDCLSWEEVLCYNPNIGGNASPLPPTSIEQCTIPRVLQIYVVEKTFKFFDYIVNGLYNFQTC